VSGRRMPAFEFMDHPHADPAQLATSLRDLGRVNRWLGGRRSALRWTLASAARIPHRPVRVLDVGTGGADIPLALVAAARSVHLALKVTGVDLHPRTVDYARAATAGDPDTEIIRGNALDLPFPDNAFHIGMMNTTLHHFGPEDAERALRELDRVARYAIVVTDLARSWTARVGAQLLAATVWRYHPITRHDGPASVRAAFTAGELRELASRSLSMPARVRREPVFRLSLVAERGTGTDLRAAPTH
jgi:2-polyprenyl-3-methyl-5-hydroxy-6-metoxy-1,4-benzoquinol methylase